MKYTRHHHVPKLTLDHDRNVMPPKESRPKRTKKKEFKTTPTFDTQYIALATKGIR